jgi:hypothetical protein
MSRTVRYGGEPCTLEQIKGTLALLRYYKRFLASGKELCVDPEDRWARYGCLHMSRGQARKRLRYLIDVAINRKAGIPDEPFRKCNETYQLWLRRDQQRLHDYLNRRIRCHGFESREVRKRFGHLIERYEE